MRDLSELRFPLDVEDGWRPVAVEGLPFDTCAAGYVATVPPLFVKDLSVGDVVAAEVGEDGLLVSWRHVHRSSNSVVWLLRTGQTHQIDATLNDLRSLGCTVAGLPSAGSYSVNVPENVPISSVDAILENLDPERVAIAYPSLRHADG
jgi:hypothetical protein